MFKLVSSPLQLNFALVPWVFCACHELFVGAVALVGHRRPAFSPLHARWNANQISHRVYLYIYLYICINRGPHARHQNICTVAQKGHHYKQNKYCKQKQRTANKKQFTANKKQFTANKINTLQAK